MAFDAIRAGDTDVFSFDFTAWFSAIQAGSIVMSSAPAGFVFGAPALVGSIITISITVPSQPGQYSLGCTASDGLPRNLTLEQSIRVVP